MSRNPDELYIVFAGSREDNSDSMIMDVLMSVSSRFQIADSPEEAIQICRSKLPDMAIVRHNRDLDGFDLAARLRALSKPPHLLIIGDENSLDAWKSALESGASAYLHKDQIAEELNNSINKIDHAIRLTRRHRASFAETERIAKAFEAMTSGALLVDGTGTVFLANHAFELLTGISLEQAKGAAIKNILGQIIEGGISSSREIMEAIVRGISWTGEFPCYYRHMREGYAEISITPLMPREDPPSSMLTIMDISDETSRFNKILTAKWAAHDLVSGQLNIENSEIQRLNTMLLSGIIPPDESVFNLRQLINETCCFNNTETHIAECFPEQFIGRNLLLGVVLRSLALWARLNSENVNTSINASIRQRNGSSWQVHFSLSSANSHTSETCYTSADEHLLNIKHSEKPSELTGIGLASWIISAIAASPLIIKSIQGKGKQASFSIWLEEITSEETDICQQGAEEATFLPWQPLASAENVTGNKRILLAEDSPLDQANIKNLLEKSGFQVVSVENGHEAVEESENNDFDLIFMDILMPVMDGFEATRLIRDREKISGIRTPIIALTSYSLKAVQDKCQRVGMNAYLPKPVSMDNLRRVLESLSLSGERHGPEEDQLSTESEPNLEMEVLNRPRAIEFLDGNEELYRELVELFLIHAPETMKELKEALKLADMSAVEAASHKIKGMAANIGADRLSNTNRQIMEDAGNGTIKDLNAWIERLKSEYSELESILKTI